MINWRIRKILNAHGRPIYLGVVKPNVGLPPKDFAAIAYEAWAGGLDAAKDDEMLADAFRTLKGSDFEAVDVSGLMINADSGQSR